VWDFTNTILVIIVVASCLFVLYDSRKKNRQTNQVWHDAGVHHRAHPGCLGHPKDCEHMTKEDE